jgi:hypothetical protein
MESLVDYRRKYPYAQGADTYKHDSQTDTQYRSKRKNPVSYQQLESYQNQNPAKTNHNPHQCIENRTDKGDESS